MRSAVPRLADVNTFTWCVRPPKRSHRLSCVSSRPRFYFTNLRQMKTVSTVACDLKIAIFTSRFLFQSNFPAAWRNRSLQLRRLRPTPRLYLESIIESKIASRSPPSRCITYVRHFFRNFLPRPLCIRSADGLLECSSIFTIIY